MNYRHLADAIDFYEGRGYTYVEDAPWLVGRDAYYATKPPDAAEDVVVQPSGLHMVASGEQSFIQMMLDGAFLKRACCLTPCFRVERWDALRRPYFEKVELINGDDPSPSNLIDMIHDALTFFQAQGIRTKVIETGREAFDIVEHSTRIELGSYGIRHMAHPDERSRDLSWIYGTGCAEPRLSTAKRRSGR